MTDDESLPHAKTKGRGDPAMKLTCQEPPRNILAISLARTTRVISFDQGVIGCL
ncbi:hypothetical protein BO82DRAFT_359457 [Aspergillus uvarum CBS 121591]|uniref:Uncharacterized protein n=1 Tax=Aspergillus uvarum CBS 121591 TaxID=1448315 RepID=A0A319D7Z7_9EURO|nr:hypothetical protein BO82DRAFT_359457 [Aspergillus uvarum CBS 121591]PYH76082.1 hypothetical protein BO82DRAFT_359457 [Aspergillus uvarum CBS 121591]